MSSDAGADMWEIAAVKARYFRYMDLKQWDRWRTVFSDDAVFDHPTIGRFEDIDEAVRATSAFIGEMWTAHEAGIPEITLHDAEHASGVFAMSSSSRPDGWDGFARTWGHYHDDFRKVDGVWKLSAMRLESFYRER